MEVDSEEIAYEFLREFNEAFPNLEKFIENCKNDAKSDGYIETLFGRRRYLPNINAPENQKRSSDERKAVNSRIQGSASDLVKLTMLKIDEELIKQQIDACILLQIHDELIFQVNDEPECVNKFIKLLIKEMEGCGRILKTKLAIKIKKGKNWSELNEVNIKDFKEAI